MTHADWRRIIDMVWRGYTVPVAFKAGGFDPDQQRKALNGRPDIKSFLVDVAIAASVREELVAETACPCGPSSQPSVV